MEGRERVRVYVLHCLVLLTKGVFDHVSLFCSFALVYVYFVHPELGIRNCGFGFKEGRVVLERVVRGLEGVRESIMISRKPQKKTLGGKQGSKEFSSYLKPSSAVTRRNAHTVCSRSICLS